MDSILFCFLLACMALNIFDFLSDIDDGLEGLNILVLYD